MKKTLIKALAGLILGGTLLAFIPPQDSVGSKTVNKTSFNRSLMGGRPKISNWGLQSAGNSVEVTSEQSRFRGGRSLKLSLAKADWSRQSNRRTEIMNTRFKEFTMGRDWWVGFSEYIPNDWENDLKGNQDVIWQFHGAVNGPGGGSPPLAAYVEGDSLRVVLRTGDVPSAYGKSNYLARFSVPKGEWSDWVIKVNFDYENGSVKIWRNGKVLVDYHGSTMYKWINQVNEKGPYLKLGIYKPGWAELPTVATKRVIYLDAITVAGSNGSYDKVKPGNDSAEVN
ncbi:polysaccharide lyase [Mucilaginibacter sp. R-33]|uniref:polysaccharide lyase n=1 Tax=unclassified Mucilaginibacter TaxID=2617802 RepID=UPI003CECF5FF